MTDEGVPKVDEEPSHGDAAVDAQHGLGHHQAHAHSLKGAGDGQHYTRLWRAQGSFNVGRLTSPRRVHPKREWEQSAPFRSGIHSREESPSVSTMCTLRQD